MSTKITVQIETANGPDVVGLTLTGQESGDNPGFNSQQVDRILADIGRRVRGMYAAYYGEQS